MSQPSYLWIRPISLDDIPDPLETEYLAKAAQAEANALKCADPDMKKGWESLARDYRFTAQWQRGCQSRKNAG